MLALSRGSVALGREAAKAAVRTFLPKTVLFCRGSRKKPRVCITFDDGPTELTAAYLDLLDSFGVRATFFLVGAACQQRPGDVLDIAEHRHELAGHGYTHRAFSELAPYELEQELVTTAALIGLSSRGSAAAPLAPARVNRFGAPVPGLGPGPQTTTRLRPRPQTSSSDVCEMRSRSRPLVRPPRGALSARALLTCARSGFTTVLWSRDSNDWRIRDPREIVERFAKDPALPGDVILFHEGQHWTLQALPRVLTQLLEAGNELVTVSELLRN